MSHRKLALCIALVLAVAAPLSARFLLTKTGEEMTLKGGKFLTTLKDDQRSLAAMPYDSARRLDWHFIPKNDRKGLQLRDMTDDQRSAAHDLLKSCLSEVGYDKATKIMELEQLLHALETKKNKNVNVRDSLRYYFTLFGEPKSDGKWGLSIEGHHLSLNFVVEKNKVISSTPTVFCTNPAIVKTDLLPALKDRRVLAKEETIAFDLVLSLDAEQQKLAITDATAPKEVRDAGKPQPPTDAPIGLPAAKMNDKQKQMLQELINAYCDNLPADVASERLEAIKSADFEKVHFCWMGATKPGIGHYYLVQGPSFVVELVNVQPDADGNPANHVHCLWRDMNGDFGLPIK